MLAHELMSVLSKWCFSGSLWHFLT